MRPWSTNCKPRSHGDLELLGIVANEVNGVTVAVKKAMSELNVRRAVDSEIMASPGTPDSGFAHRGECLEYRVERMPEHISVCPDAE